MTQWGLDNLFNPGKRHMDDEKRRLQSTREEIGDASGGRRIDLEGGTVSISVPGRRPAADTTADTVDPIDDDADTDGTGDALAPALDAEDVPAVALASDVDLEPEVVEPTTAEDIAPEAAASVSDEPVVTAEAESEPEAEPAPAVAPRRRAVSASAWARRG